MWFKSLGLRTLIIGVALVIGIIVGTFGFGLAIANNQYNNLSNQSHIPAPVFPRNANGQTYGSDTNVTSPDQEPDLVSAVGVGGTQGYVRSVDMYEEMPKTPQEALAHNSKLKAVRKIPLYAVDGKTVIGVFEIHNGKGIEISAEKKN